MNERKKLEESIKRMKRVITGAKKIKEKIKKEKIKIKGGEKA